MKGDLLCCIGKAPFTGLLTMISFKVLKHCVKRTSSSAVTKQAYFVLVQAEQLVKDYEACLES